ncbi:MAG: DUF4783 domain-containing protein [Bacteroidota bacterium]
MILGVVLLSIACSAGGLEEFPAGQEGRPLPRPRPGRPHLLREAVPPGTGADTLREMTPGEVGSFRGSLRPGSGSGESGEQEVFRAVSDGLSSGSVGRLAPYFGSHVSLSLRGGESGSFSANQAYYVLESYLRVRRFGRLTFSSTGASAAGRYATGSATILHGGGGESVQVYVLLTRSGSRWVIARINVY